ncbi:cysteine-rich CWC family protein [Paraburkholderia jirisanensis]
MNPTVARPASSEATDAHAAPDAHDSRDPQSARCPRCGRSFDCGREAQAADCWCHAMPPLPAELLKPGSRCMCPECLVEEIARAHGNPAAAAAADD